MCGAKVRHQRKHKTFLLANLVQQVLDGRLPVVGGHEAAQNKCNKQSVPVSKCVATVRCHGGSTGCQDVP